MPNVLMIAYHFPPSAISSGHLRTVALGRYLPQFGWRPIVLSAHVRAYPQIDEQSMAELPGDLQVVRAFALDTRRHLGIRGSYPVFLAQPDRWVSWWAGAVPAGLRLIRRQRPSVIWSTYPIATAHLIAYTLHRITGLPWIADFRDPVSNAGAGSSPLKRRIRTWVERKTIEHAAYNVFTAEGAARMHIERYPRRCAENFVVIPNGYDEADFADFPIGRSPVRRAAGPLRLVHSGILYREQRDPTAFFTAVAELFAAGEISPNSLQVVLRASGHEQHYGRLIGELGIGDIVVLQPQISYRGALQEQYDADGLLLFQGSGYNSQIPAKVYEYLRMGKPIFALTDPSGDTAATLRGAGVGSIVEMNSKDAITSNLRQFISGIHSGAFSTLSAEQIAKYSRRSRAEELAALLERAITDKTD